MKEAERLTKKEEEILLLIKKGMTNREISEAIFISEGTVKHHVKSILAKFQIHDRKKLIAECTDKNE